MPTQNTDISLRATSYPTVVYRDDITTVPIDPSILNTVIEEMQETLTDETINRSYLEQLIAEHQTECVSGHDVLAFLDHVEQQSEGFVAGYTDSFVYLVVDKHEVWSGEAEWMPWDENDQYLLTTAYTREVLDIGKSDTADWAVNGLDVSEQAGYIVPIQFPFRSISQADSIDADPIALAQNAAQLADKTVLHPTVADCVVLLDAIDQPSRDAMTTTAELLGIGVSEVEGMINETQHLIEQAQRTTEELQEFEAIPGAPESFYQ